MFRTVPQHWKPAPRGAGTLAEATLVKISCSLLQEGRVYSWRTDKRFSWKTEQRPTFTHPKVSRDKALPSPPFCQHHSAAFWSKSSSLINGVTHGVCDPRSLDLKFRPNPCAETYDQSGLQEVQLEDGSTAYIQHTVHMPQSNTILAIQADGTIADLQADAAGLNPETISVLEQYATKVPIGAVVESTRWFVRTKRAFVVRRFALIWCPDDRWRV